MGRCHHFDRRLRHQEGGTGANVGASRTIAAQDGQDVSGGTNNNGGTVTLRAGAVGARGTGGSAGSIKLNSGGTDFFTFSLVSGAATIAGRDVNCSATTWPSICSSYTVFRAPSGYLDHNTLNLRTSVGVQTCAVTIADAFVENFSSGVSVDRQVSGASRLFCDANGTRLTGNIRFDADISPSALSGNVTDYGPTGIGTAQRVRIDPGGAARTINSLVAGVDGERKRLINIATNTSHTLTLLHDDGATGTAANRFLCPSNANVVIRCNGSVEIEYDGTSSRWRVLAV